MVVVDDVVLSRNGLMLDKPPPFPNTMSIFYISPLHTAVILKSVPLEYEPRYVYKLGNYQSLCQG